MAKLVIQSSNGEPVAFPLLGREILIGRLDSADLVLEDTYEGLFRPVATRRVQKVSNEDLRRVFRAVADFGIQRLTQ